MQVKSISETKRVRYLLGLSFPAEREQIESEYFEDDNAFQRMLTAEDDLIDAYARGELVGEERLIFEKRFASSTRGRARVQFARAFAGAASETQPMETKPPATFFTTFQRPAWLRIAAVIVFVALLAWLVGDRRRLTNELRELRAESAELSKRIEGLQPSSDTERTRTTEVAAQRTDLLPQPDKRTHRDRVMTTATQRMRNLPKEKTDPQKFALREHESTEVRAHTQDATLGNTFVSKRITRRSVHALNVASLLTLQSATPGGGYVAVSRTDQANITLDAVEGLKNGSPLPRNMNSSGETTVGNTFGQNRITELPLNANNVVGLLSLQPGVNRIGSVNGARADQSNITLDGVDLNTLNTYSLTPRNTNSGDETSIQLQSFLSWVRFQIVVETAAIHEDYRLTIKTADGHPVSSVDWIEPLTPNQTIIDTPAISTSDLPSGNYVLFLMGKEPNGSFIKVAEYAFKVIKY